MALGEPCSVEIQASDKGDVMIRVYDSGVVLREDIIERVR